MHSRQNTVSFSGYRASKLPSGGEEESVEIREIKRNLEKEIASSYTAGFDTYMVGMAEGFDLIAAECVLELKKTHPDIKLIAVVPFDDDKIHSEKYNEVIRSADDVKTLSKQFHKGTYLQRNEYLVDNSSKLICYYDGIAGGTEYTVDYANKKGIQVVNLAPKEEKGPKTIDNVNNILRDDLVRTIRANSRLNIAASCFSIYAYRELKKRLSEVEELRFIFTSPTFVAEKTAKEKREFYIPRLTREKSLYGTEFEVKLRNELTQKAIARECAEWIRKKAVFKSNITNENMYGFINVNNDIDKYAYIPIHGFTTSDIGCERGNNAYNIVTRLDFPASMGYINTFEELWNDPRKLQDVTEQVIESISTVYNENSPEFIYFVTLYNIFSTFLEDISEDVLPNDATGFKNSVIWNKLYNFQKDAALGIINKLEQYNGCILADSVGLGKTYTALAVIKYYESRGKSVLVLCPKKLAENWKTYSAFFNYKNNPLEKDRLSYRVLYHTDLSRERGNTNGFDFERSNWSNFDLVVIDESHNFRNGGETIGEDNRENRYLKLMNKVIRAGVNTKVLMLSATPVNNRFIDLKNQLALAYEGESENINSKLNISRGIDEIFRQAQGAFGQWSKLPADERTADKLLSMLSFDFFEILDSVTIARSRKHIEKYYETSDIGKFPERLKPISKRPSLTTRKNAINYNEIYEQLEELNLKIYTPSEFIHGSKIDKYEAMYNKNKANIGLTQANREQGIKKLMSINLLKRLESSVYSFKLTLQRIKTLIDETIEVIENYRSGTTVSVEDWEPDSDFDYDDMNTDLFSVGKKIRIELGDMDYSTWSDYLAKDAETLELLLTMIDDITPEYDKKLQTLIEMIRNKINNPINGDNKKVIVFTAFSDTAEYLYDNVSKAVKSEFGLDTAMITGSVDGLTTIDKLRADMNTVLTLFSPISKDKAAFMPDDRHNIDILIATDCISEGQNLQDCDYLINYDIHWNPVRIIQRFGRIDRIGSKNRVIQLVNFWPDMDLDSYINLKSRVEQRMKISVMTSTGTGADDLLSDSDEEMEYRKQQLKRLKEEVVDLEDMSSGISIMDLGLNDFRMDLISYIKDHPNLDKVPFGMHAVTSGEKPGVIYILKNINENIDIENRNRLHPFYMVYIGNDGEIITNHLQPKETLDALRLVCRGRTEPDTELCKRFNKETKDGRSMKKYSELLEAAIASIISVNDDTDIESLFSEGDTTALTNVISGLDDFELICFIVVKENA